MRPVVLLTALGLIVLILVWLFVFFVPQSKKLSSLQQERVSLNALIARDNARVQQLRTESNHINEIKSMYTSLQGYVPATQELYTYIQVFSSAAKTAGIGVTSLSPGPPAAVKGTPFNAIPIIATVKGQYSDLVSLIQGIYQLPRLTDINGLSITGGGPGSGTVPITATLNLAIFTSQKTATGSTS